MKTKLQLTIYVLFFILGLSACSYTAETEKLPDGNIPVHLFASIAENKQLGRVTGNSFDEGDLIGVYLVPYETGNTVPGNISTSIYAQNIGHRYDGIHWANLSGNQLVWPGIRKADIYGYYPFDESLDNPVEYQFSVSADQRTDEAYIKSDFLWSRSSALVPSRNVQMTFFHKLSKVNINIRSTNGIFDDDVDAAQVLLGDVYGAGIINLADATVNLPSDGSQTDILTRRQAAAEGYDMSFTAIIMPQAIQPGHGIIVINNKEIEYAYRPTGSIQFKQGETTTFNIVVSRLGVEVTVDAISDWEVGGEFNSDVNEPAPRIVDINTIDWNKSNVHHIYDGNTLLGQIVKEYLYKSGTKVDFPAIVAYPADADGKIDFTKGFVAQVFNRTMNSGYGFDINTKTIHGGSISFTATNTFGAYTEGTLAAVGKIHITSDGEFTAAPDNAIPILTHKPYTLEDYDGNIYPIVKIATQYWTRDNLRTEHYRDGSTIDMYYYNNDPTTYRERFGGLYPWGALFDTRGMIPEGWKVPSEEDWYALRNYIYPDPAPKLKTPGVWLSGTANNVTGFSAMPGGRKTNTTTFNQLYEYGQWWSSTNNTNSGWRVYFGTSTIIGSDYLSKNYTQSVRIVRDGNK